VIGLLLNITLAGEDLGFTASDLFAESRNLTLAVIVGSVLFVQKETSILGLLFEALKANQVAVVAGLEVVVLKKFLVLEVAVLSLDCVELVAEGKVVLVALLNLKDFGLKLRDE